MKQTSTILNIILVIAVGVLYYLHFSGPKDKIKPVTYAAKAPMVNTGNRPPIAYIDMDSIYEKITYIRTRRKELEGEQRGIESEWENAYRELEGRKNNFLKKGSAITNQMAQEFQGELMRDQQIADNRKQERTQKLSERHYEFMEDISKKLKDFLAEYNTEKNYMYIFTAGTGLDYMVYKDSSFNITDDVIVGMNEKLKPSK